MGLVYRARDTRLNRDVAIKVLPEAFSTDRDRLRRFEQEARAAAALSHANIVSIYDVGTHEGQPYVVSELLEGQTLRDILRGGALPLDLALRYAMQLCQGLAAAHQRGIIHRDLKPENLFITENWTFEDPRFRSGETGGAQSASSPVLQHDQGHHDGTRCDDRQRSATCRLNRYSERRPTSEAISSASVQSFTRW